MTTNVSLMAHRLVQDGMIRTAHTTLTLFDVENYLNETYAPALLWRIKLMEAQHSSDRGEQQRICSNYAKRRNEWFNECAHILIEEALEAEARGEAA